MLVLTQLYAQANMAEITNTDVQGGPKTRAKVVKESDWS